MMKTTSVPQKKRGRPATGQIPHVTTRLPQEILDGLKRYVNEGKAKSKTEAIRRILMEYLKRRGFLSDA
jgi:hypothetical protein